MSYLIVSSITPTLGSGTGLRTYGVTAALARHGAVELAYVVFKAPSPAPEYAELGNVTTRPLLASRGVRRGIEFVRAVSEGLPVGIARGISPELSRALAGVSADVRVIADGPVAAAALLPLTRRRELVYLAHNLESSRFPAGSERRAHERLERRVFRAFSESWMATRADERGARALAGERIATRYVPNVVDVNRIKPVGGSGDGRLLFVASFTYAPNVEAFGFLVDEVLPAVWETMPDVRLCAVGAGLPEASRDPRIETPGFVEDLASAYAAADIAIVPLLRGAGSPLKFVEGLAYGLPVLTTPHAAGLLEDGVAGRDFVVGDGATELAAAIAALLGDPARAGEIGSAGRAVVERYYSVDHLTTLLGS
jgi:glycosyltransferase involved in cell wall biosynthesis